MEKEKWYNILIRVVAAILMIAAIFYWYYHFYKSQKNITPVATNSNLPQSSATNTLTLPEPQNIITDQKTENICTNHKDQIKWVSYSDNDILFEYPDYMNQYDIDMVQSRFISPAMTPLIFWSTLNDNTNPLGLDKARIYIDIIETQQPDITSWEKNECQDKDLCLSYDDKDKINDKFEEHYWYRRSGLNWDNIKNGNFIVRVTIPYPFVCGASEINYVSNHIIKTLNFKNK